MNSERLLGIVGFQARQLQVAEGVIDRLGQTPAYRRTLWRELERDLAAGENHPADLLNAAREAAGCQGSSPRPAQPTPLDDYLEVTNHE